MPWLIPIIGATDGVEQIIVDIVGLQLFQRVVEHLDGVFARVCVEV